MGPIRESLPSAWQVREPGDKCMGISMTDLQLNKEVADNGPSRRRPDISLQTPPRHLGFGSTRGGRSLDHSQSFSKGISSPGGFLRALSLKRKGNTSYAERSSLLNSDPKAATDSPNVANFMSAASWKRCTSLPITPATNLSPSVSTPASARTYSEQPKRHVNRMRERSYSSLLLQDISFYDSETVGDMTSRLGADCQRVSIGNDLNLILRNVLQGAGALIYLLVLSWPLGLCTLGICTILSSVILIYGRYQKKAASLVQEVIASANQVAQETLSLIRTVRVDGTGGEELGRYKWWLRKLADTSLRQSAP